MKRLFLLLLLIFISNDNAAFAQQKPSIFGVVMGISKYQNVPSLRFADKDAMSFYNFLLSPAGGGADTNKIRLLLNEKATSYNFFEAMDNLLDMAKEGDQVYIYFAGHGDIEKKTERQNGFLIGYNAPSNCYAAGGCISVRFLQDYVETLISKNKSKVTLIIDACRSGKLAGGAEGAEVTALALKAEWKGVTKILSCQPGETSLEGEKWGGGAGVFSYFMLKGLLGQADRDGDGIVSVMELNNFLDENVLRETNKKQLPEIVGDRRQDIVKVDKKHALAMLNQMEKPITLPPEKNSAGFEADVSSIKDVSVLKEYVKFKEYINNNNLIDYAEADSVSPSKYNKETALSIYRSLESKLEANPILTLMKRELLAALQNKSQIIMNGWINGLQTIGKEYDSAYKESTTAFNLIDSTYYQYDQIKFKYLLLGVRYVNDNNERFKIMEQCLKLSPDEPSINNDLGIYYGGIKKFDESNYYLDKAIELSKNWAWAWGNKGANFIDMGKPEVALKYLDKAIELKPDLATAWYNKGQALKILGKNNEAMTCYDRALDISPDNYLSWGGKGIFLSELQKYEEAIKCYDKAIEIKSDYFEAWVNKGVAYYSLQKYEEAIKYFDIALELSRNYPLVWRYKGFALYNLGKYDEANKCLDKAIELNPNNFEAYDVKGYYLFMSGSHDEGLNLINKALEINPEYANAWNNKACCYAILKNKPEMLKSLKKAFELDKKYKIDAPKYDVFKEYWSDPDFMELVK